MAADVPRRRRDGALGVVGAVTLGAMSATLVAPPALAEDPEYPSWSDVQRAKADGSAAAKEAERITGLLGDLQDRADAAGRTASIATERFHLARLAEDEARARHTALAARADLAAATARTSRMRAGLLAASAARSGGADLRLLLDAAGADDFLHRLATVSQLSAQSQAITQRALADENSARALGDQADAASTALTQRAEEAQDALGAAERASAAALDAVQSEQQHADRLVAQLAALRGTSTRLAAQYAAGVRAARSEAAASAAEEPAQAEAQEPAEAGTAAPVGAAPPAPAPSRTPSGSTPARPSPPASPAPSTPSTSARPATPSAPPKPSPPPRAPAAAPAAAPVPAPAPPVAAGEPNSAQAASAVAFARDQIGDAYRFGGAGPSSWDCSGLTMQSYASVGLGIGGHSATAQYSLARAQGRLVPYGQVRVGDLIFYTDGGGDMYHVALYSGNEMMIEAPYAGVPVREVPVRAGDRVGMVARPTAS